VPPPTLDGDGCPSLAGVGAQPMVRTPIPAGVTTTYYVSASGDDTNAGTDSTKPLASLTRVQALVTAGTIAGGTAVLFHAGDRFHGQLSLTAKNTGTASAPVVLGAYGTGPAPVILGTLPLAASAFTAQGSMYVAPITGTPERLFFGTQEIFQARFPNAQTDESKAVIRAVSGTANTLVLNTSDLAGLPTLGAELWVRTQSWRRDRVHVDMATMSGAQVTLTLSKTEIDPGGPPYAATGPSTSVAAGAGVYLEGLLAYLDADAEWAVDSGKLYFQPPAGATIGSSPIEVSLPGPVIAATGVTNLVVQDLEIDWGEGSGVQANVRGAGPTIANTTFTSPYYAGVNIIGTAVGPIVKGNTVTGSRNYGIFLAGATNATTTHNEIASSGQGQHATYGVGVADLGASGDVIDHNFIHDTGQAGIEFGGSAGLTVQRNVVVRSPSYFGDAGSVYWNFDGGGNLVELNVFCLNSSNIADAIPTADPATNGIYLDDDVRPAVIRQNTVLRANACGLTVVSQGTDVAMTGGPQVPSHTIDDNVFVGSGDAQGGGKEGGQLCYAHAYETTNGAHSATLGQLKSVSGNVFTPLQFWQRAYKLTSYEANHDFGTLDGNLFALPLAAGMVYVSSPSTPTGTYSLAGWQSAGVSGGKDLTSTVGAPQRTACELATLATTNEIPDTQAWIGTSDKGFTNLHLPAPAAGQTQAFIANGTPLPTTAGATYLVTIKATAAAPIGYTAYFTNAADASTMAASRPGLVADVTSAREAFVLLASGGMTLQIVAQAALTVDDVEVTAVTTTECKESLLDRVTVLTNTTDANQSYDLGSGWLDMKGNAINAPVPVPSFQSVVVQKKTLAF
jgi:parallel beta-helix repeat protein